ncbi:hypothetical protein CIT292_10813 [Citrobacter youngae ATCC 29220]|uniref:Uncharacterized protein n=1 Tax=Citrobacter youngae ATCC 29220 TaxID=500640 RepID=D4BJH0_9ENTR|nr:hypothetical protein CIT292_10813 [Citrobacter youngae ATCC 29220]
MEQSAGWRLTPYPAYNELPRRPDKRSAIRQGRAECRMAANALSGLQRAIP